MSVPKRKKSKMRIRMRKAQKKATIASTSTCPNCGVPVQTHRACPNCGMYRGRKVLNVAVEA